MGRIIGFDYGEKRTGLATTDPEQIIAGGLDAMPTPEVIPFLKQYMSRETVDLFVVGIPGKTGNREADATQHCLKFIKKLKVSFPDIPVKTIDESFTSRMAVQSMVAGGLSKKKRRDKLQIDKVSATLILQSFMEQYTP